jgi:hypothetical protein
VLFQKLRLIVRISGDDLNNLFDMVLFRKDAMRNELKDVKKKIDDEDRAR